MNGYEGPGRLSTEHDWRTGPTPTTGTSLGLAAAFLVLIFSILTMGAYAAALFAVLVPWR